MLWSSRPFFFSFYYIGLIHSQFKEKSLFSVSPTVIPPINFIPSHGWQSFCLNYFFLNSLFLEWNTSFPLLPQPCFPNQHDTKQNNERTVTDLINKEF